MQPIGIYIHVPFCGSKCAYCDFYSRVRQDQKAAYLDALTAEIRSYANRELSADTIFFGGGTPSLLTPDELSRILTAIRDTFSLAVDPEITMEMNPETVSLSYLCAVRQLGVNRLSFGMQSAIPQELSALGRKHDFLSVQRAVSAAREAGFTNLTLDLMLGIPYQTTVSLQETLHQTLALRPEHLSCYLLKIEEGTPFYRRHAEKLCASEDETADFYLTVCETLRQQGFVHYEISNFALPGLESRHNLKYWRDEPYLGFGPAAHSCLNGQRFFNPADLDRYIVSGGSCQCVETKEPAGTASERLMLGLRLSEGVDLSELEELCSFPPREQTAFLNRCVPFARAGLLTVDGNRVALTERGMLVSNLLLSEILPD